MLPAMVNVCEVCRRKANAKTAGERKRTKTDIWVVGRLIISGPSFPKKKTVSFVLQYVVTQGRASSCDLGDALLVLIRSLRDVRQPVIPRGPRPVASGGSSLLGNEGCRTAGTNSRTRPLQSERRGKRARGGARRASSPSSVPLLCPLSVRCLVI